MAEQVFKIYNDGSHYLATRFFQKPTFTDKDGNIQECRKLESDKVYSSEEFISENGCRKNSRKTFNSDEFYIALIKKSLLKNLFYYSDYNELIRVILWDIIKEYEKVIIIEYDRPFESLKMLMNLTIKDYLKVIVKKCVDSFLLIGKSDEETYKLVFDKCFSLFGYVFRNEIVDFEMKLEMYIRDFIKNFSYQQKKNLGSRIKRFKIKAYSNKWNYFVTFTYDDSKMDEESFKRRLKRKLNNLHTRNGWKYMGVFEKSPKGRLHFHGLLYVPSGQMVGDVVSVRDYSTKNKSMQLRFENTEFSKKFGINDFKHLNSFEIKRTDVLNYITKYISKTDERIVYSRDIPSFIYAKLEDSDKSIITKIVDEMVTRYVLFDDSLESSIRINIKRIQI